MIVDALPVATSAIGTTLLLLALALLLAARRRGRRAAADTADTADTPDTATDTDATDTADAPDTADTVLDADPETAPDADPEAGDVRDAPDAAPSPDESTDVRALRAQVRVLEQALEAAAEPAPPLTVPAADASYRDRVRLAVRVVVLGAAPGGEAQQTAARILAAVERLDAPDVFARPVLPEPVQRVAPPSVHEHRPSRALPDALPDARPAERPVPGPEVGDDREAETPDQGSAPSHPKAPEVVLPVPPPAPPAPRRGRRRLRHSAA
jgi:hypothetical protein